MGKVRRGFLTGTKLNSGRIFDERTRKSCKCCQVARLDGERFSAHGFCEACSLSRLLNSYNGNGVCEHWTEGPNGERTDYHLALIGKPTQGG